MKTKPIKRILQGIGLLLAFFCFVESAMFFEIVRSNGSSSAYFAHRVTIDGEFMAFVWKIIFFSSGFLVPYALFRLVFALWAINRENDISYMQKPMIHFGIALLCIPASVIYFFLLDPLVNLLRDHEDALILISLITVIFLYFGTFIILQEFKKLRILIPPDVDVWCKCDTCGEVTTFEATRLKTHNILSSRKRH